VFQASDGEVMIATASEAQFPRLCAALGLDDVAADARFASMADRLANRQPLNQAISVVIAGQPVCHWLSHLGKAGISCGRVNDLAEAWALPVVAERGLLDSMQLRLPIDLNGPQLGKGPPKLSEHSREILEQAGFDSGVIGKLGF
jgi:crotonobetainyl-CoA:carnitine CoA-transferase CaiB-like acyl-CoA transferase